MKQGLVHPLSPGSTGADAGASADAGVAARGRDAVSVSTDRIAGSDGGGPNRVLLCGPYRRLRWRRGGLGPPMQTETSALVPEKAIGSPSWSARRRGSPLPSWEPGAPSPFSMVDAPRSPGGAPTSRPVTEASAPPRLCVRSQQRYVLPTRVARRPRHLCSFRRGPQNVARARACGAGRVRCFLI
jgi:hypothetical protein